jgi:holliday junction DNA helicase RuvA
MIAYLLGKILYKGQGFIIIKTNNIGYKVFINSALYSELDVNREVELYIHHHVREDAVVLYGFNDMEELEMFELLLTISGIGPKSALATLSVTNVDELKEYISQGDSSLLIKVSGIGKKTAERIVLELREKIIKASGNKKQGSNSNLIKSDEIDALMALGYSLFQARDALKDVDPEIKESGERIREALRKLGK